MQDLDRLGSKSIKVLRMCKGDGAVLYRPKPRDLNYIEKSFVISVSLLILYVSIFCHYML